MKNVATIFGALIILSTASGFSAELSPNSVYIQCKMTPNFSASDYVPVDSTGIAETEFNGYRCAGIADFVSTDISKQMDDRAVINEISITLPDGTIVRSSSKEKHFFASLHITNKNGQDLRCVCITKPGKNF